MKYLHIKNKGSLNRKLLELIGLSTKRDKMSQNGTIGNKGSGTKLAAVAALRLNLSTGISSRDPQGSYFLEFDTDEVTVEGVVSHHVHYHYYLNEGGEPEKPKRLRFPSNMVVEAFPDWDKPIGTDDKKTFKMLREHVCNAYDEDKDFEWALTDERCYAGEGQTTVYLEYTEEFGKILDVPERYFKFMSRHHAYATVDGIGEIWPKSDVKNTRLFLLGVLADCDSAPARSSLFDYSLYDKAMLSEERILKSPSTYQSAVGGMFGKLDDADICITVMRGIAEGKAKFEERALGCLRNPRLTPEARVAWLRAVHEVFGPKVALPASANEVANSDAVQIYGYTLLRQGSHDFHLFLKDLGVPNAEDVFPKNPEDRLELVPFEGLDEASRQRFTAAWKLFAKHFPQRTQYPIYFFHPLDEAMRRMLGFAGYGETAFKEIWIQAKTRTELPSLQSLLIILAHESRHCMTRKYDHERGFNEATEQDLLAEILRQAAAATKAGDDPTRPFGKEPLLDPIFGDPSSKAAPTVGEPAPVKPAAGAEVESTVFGEIDVDFDPSPDEILERIDQMLKEK